MRIAITGGIAEGKSTILEWIREEGWPVHSSDRKAREIFADPQINGQLARIAGGKGQIATADLRKAILESVSVRRQVNSLLHPLIQEHSANLDGFFEVPLLIEDCLQNRYDQVWVVTCGPQEQFERLMDRYASKKLVNAILGVQLSSRVKLAFADRVLRTNEPFGHVRSLLRQALQELGSNAKRDA